MACHGMSFHLISVGSMLLASCVLRLAPCFFALPLPLPPHAPSGCSSAPSLHLNVFFCLHFPRLLHVTYQTEDRLSTDSTVHQTTTALESIVALSFDLDPTSSSGLWPHAQCLLFLFRHIDRFEPHKTPSKTPERKLFVWRDSFQNKDDVPGSVGNMH